MLMIAVGIIIGLFQIVGDCTGCSCASSSSSHSSNPDAEYSERAKELGRTTKEYRDAVNYWYYGNP